MLSSLKTAYRDHPRRCGENTSRDSFFLPGKGSPPQVRGKHCNVLSQRTAIGITPAGAGKTYRQHEHVETAEDHPRRCGENPQSPAQIFRALGSPPQVRGKPTPLQSHAPLSGITPAGAGKTLHFRRRYSARKDHPRRCGENWYEKITDTCKKGSPPQVRGKLVYLTPAA